MIITFRSHLRDQTYKYKCLLQKRELKIFTKGLENVFTKVTLPNFPALRKIKDNQVARGI